MKTSTPFIKQNGAATLLITMVLMLLITSAAIFTAKFSSQDVRISANDYRAKQAETAAQAGVDHTLNILNKQDIINNNAATGTIGPANLTATIGGQNIVLGSYQATYEILDLNNAAATMLGKNNLVRITSTGKSADNSASKKIETMARFAPVLVNEPKGNIIARGNVKLGTGGGGNITIDNDKSKFFVWSGGAITNYSGSTALDNSSGIFSSSLSPKPQLLPNDTLLSATLNDASGDKYFRAFFGADRTVIKKLATVVDGSDSNLNIKLSNGGRFYWLTGNVILNNSTYGGSTTNPGPVIIFVENGATLTLNNATINGLLYIDTSWTHGSGSMSTINGALIINGNLAVANAGKLTINYPYSTIIQKLPKYVGVYAHVAGSWQEK